MKKMTQGLFFVDCNRGIVISILSHECRRIAREEIFTNRLRILSCSFFLFVG